MASVARVFIVGRTVLYKHRPSAIRINRIGTKSILLNGYYSRCLSTTPLMGNKDDAMRNGDPLKASASNTTAAEDTTGSGPVTKMLEVPLYYIFHFFLKMSV